jgi:hypothetical protein
MKNHSNLNPERFYGYKHWTLEDFPRCFYVGKGRSKRSHSHIQRNHKWHAVVERYGLRVEVCIGPITNELACAWEIDAIIQESTFSTDHSHSSPEIGCNFTKGGDTGATGYKWSEEQRQRQSLKMKGRPGHSQDEETRRKIGLATCGRQISLEAREKISRANLRENLSQETLEKRSSGIRKCTLKLNSEGDVIEKFASLKEAAKSIGGSNTKLCIAIKHQRRYKNFLWKYE